MYLALHQQRIDYGAAIVHHHVLDPVDLAGVNIHIHHRYVRTVSSCEVCRVVDVSRL